MAKSINSTLKLKKQFNHTEMENKFYCRKIIYQTFFSRPLYLSETENFEELMAKFEVLKCLGAAKFKSF